MYQGHCLTGGLVGGRGGLRTHTLSRLSGPGLRVEDSREGFPLADRLTLACLLSLSLLTLLLYLPLSLPVRMADDSRGPLGVVLVVVGDGVSSSR